MHRELNRSYTCALILPTRLAFGCVTMFVLLGCYERFRTTGAVYTHMKTRHPRCANSPFTCVIDGCEEPFNDKKSIRKHIVDDHEQKINTVIKDKIRALQLSGLYILLKNVFLSCSCQCCRRCYL